MPIRSATADGVLTLTIDRPERRNALDVAGARVLLAGLQAVAADPAVRCVVLTGEGQAFCAGADVSPDGREQASAAGAELLPVANEVVRAVVTLPVPVVAVVRGPAAGVGMSLALACDLVLADEDAYFLSAFINIGLMPDGGASHFLPASMGRARAAAVAMLGERLPAREAHAAGLITSVWPAGELQAEVDRVVRRLAAAAPNAMAATKAALHAGAADALEAALRREQEGQDRLIGTPENVEGITAFLERRPAAFPPRG